MTTLTHPTTTIDQEAMRALSARVDALIASGAWSEEEWNAAMDEAVQYSGSVSGARDWLLREGAPDWKDRRLNLGRPA